MAPRQSDNHDPFPVSSLEVTAETAVQMVPDPRPVRPADLGLCQEAEVPRDGQRYVSER